MKELLIQKAEELRAEYAFSLVCLEVDIRYLRLEGRTRQKRKAMLQRDHIETNITLLDEYITELSN